MRNAILPVILCGGLGTRLAPVSNTETPKPFLTPPGHDQSLLNMAIERVASSDLFAPPLLIGHTDYKNQMIEHAPHNANILLEPKSKNTAPAVIIGALTAQSQGYDVMMILPSDHIISPVGNFQNTALNALKYTAPNIPVFIGIHPTDASRHMGYIKRSQNNKFEGFVEKPDEQNARALITDHNALWNTAIVTLHIASFLDDIQEKHPDIFTLCRDAFQARQGDQNITYLPDAFYDDLPSIAIDRLWYETLSDAHVVKADFQWQDVGTLSTWNQLENAA